MGVRISGSRLRSENLFQDDRFRCDLLLAKAMPNMTWMMTSCLVGIRLKFESILQSNPLLQHRVHDPGNVPAESHFN